MGRAPGRRISALVQTVEPCHRVVDVGSDHGLIARFLARREDIDFVLATDISEDSLAKLREILPTEPARIREKIQMQVTDGLRELCWSSLDAIVIAGMGGELMTRILAENIDFARRAGQWVLSPQKSPEHLRRFLMDQDVLVRETMIKDGKHRYPILNVCTQKKMTLEYRKYAGFPYGLEYGPHLLEQRHPELIRYLEEERRNLLKLSASIPEQASSSALEKKASMLRKAQWISKYCAEEPDRGAEKEETDSRGW